MVNKKHNQVQHYDRILLKMVLHHVHHKFLTGKYEVEVLAQVMPTVDFFDAPIMKATNLKRDLEEELQAFNNLTKITVPMDVELAGKLGFNVE